MTTESAFGTETTSNTQNKVDHEEALRRKKLREQIELREMARSLHIDDNDWDAAFGD